MNDPRQIVRLEDLAGRTINLATFVGNRGPHGFGELAIKFTDDSYVVIKANGDGHRGWIWIDGAIDHVHRVALGLMTADDLAAYEAKVERDRADEEAADRRELARLQAKLARGRGA